MVREGNQRATSVHPTQAEAAKEGPDQTEFVLHAKTEGAESTTATGKQEQPRKEKK